jgi:hypothetical protein
VRPEGLGKWGEKKITSSGHVIHGNVSYLTNLLFGIIITAIWAHKEVCIPSFSPDVIS